MPASTSPRVTPSPQSTTSNRPPISTRLEVGQGPPGLIAGPAFRAQNRQPRHLSDLALSAGEPNQMPGASQIWGHSHGRRPSPIDSRAPIPDSVCVMPKRRHTGILRRSAALTRSRYWKPRVVFWLGALAIGAVSAAFAWMADAAQHLFASTFVVDGWRRFLPLIVTPAGFVLCAWVALRFVPGSQGSGIPQAIAARHIRSDEERMRFLSPRMIVGKILLTCVGLLSGASNRP